jgi:Large ribosomal RNA subunit accumulation protein YceD
MTRETLEQPWSAPLAVSDVPETGRSVALAADERTRAAVAEIAGLRSLPRLEATFDVALHGRDGLHVTGRVTATVGQSCVVTLEPIESEVVEDIELVFAPAAAPVIVEEDGDKVEIAAVEAPEPLSGGTVDLGAIATEFLILGINPYPRKPGVVFEPPAVGADTDGPFAALKALRKTPGGPR